ncbi:uncharacterized protein [Medicago truncatula]|nr:uncharacterized protein LOC112419091 [Medicago truncatula]
MPESDDPKNDPLKKKWMVYLGVRWNGFKAQLTSEYIAYPNPERPPPYARYPFIKEHIWKRFVESRNTDEFKAKIQKGRDCVAKNIYRHTLSRGGYELLQEKMMKEKRKVLEESGDVDDILNDDLSLSPPSRHDTWKRARQKKGGEYTSEAAKVVAEKIDALVEETAKGTFVPQGRDDILTRAIGTKEHGGRVCGVGPGYTLSNYFGRSSRLTQTIDVNQHLSQLQTNLERQIKEKFDAEFEQKMAVERELMQQAFLDKLKTMGFTQTLQINEEIEHSSPQKVAVHGSTKGSCTAAQENYKDDLTIDNVQKLLCMVLRSEEDIRIPLEHEPNTARFFIPAKCIRELLVGNAWLDFSILQLWCTCMHRLCISRNRSKVFGILDPVCLDFNPTDPSTKSKVQGHIQTRLRDLNKVCYLAPYLFKGHRQLIIICPKDNSLVVLCSMHRDLNEGMIKIVSKALEVHQLCQGNRKKAKWFRPKPRKQPNGNDCGYYVMKNMLDIISANITKSWMEVFNDPTALTEDDLYDLRNQWATCFLDLYNA